MRKLKFFIPILLFFIAIGYAAISASLSIEGNVTIISNYDDYKVYFSKVLVNGEENDGVVDSETKLAFDVRLVEPGDQYVLTYDVTNGSKYFDASVTMSCTGGDANIGIDNQFDTSDLPALSSRTGILTVKKLKSNSSQENIAYSITCNLVAESVDRTSPGSGEVLGPLPPYKYKVGTEISIGDEKFNVISSTDTTVTMLAQYNLDRSYRQNGNGYDVNFSSKGWEYTPGPKEIDIQTYGGDIVTYLNEYSSYLRGLIWDINLTSDLITLTELGDLGCAISFDYSFNSDLSYNCSDSKYIDWLDNSSYWWTKSAVSSYMTTSTVTNYTVDELVWVVMTNRLYGYTYLDPGDQYSVRPVVTVSRNALEKDLILFTIGGVSYNAEAGMTWGEWVDSEYNTDLEFNIVTFSGSDRLVPAPTDNYDPGVALHYGPEPQTTETVIQHGYAYALGAD